MGEGRGLVPRGGPYGAVWRGLAGSWPPGMALAAWRFVDITPDIAGMRSDYRSLRGVRYCRTGEGGTRGERGPPARRLEGVRPGLVDRPTPHPPGAPL